MKVRIPYINNPGHHDVCVKHLGGVAVELEAYGGVLPLVPGDQLEITGVDTDGIFVATLVTKQRDCYLYELNLRTPSMMVAGGDIDIDGLDDMNWAAAEMAADEVEKALEQYVQSERPSRFTLQVATEDLTWLASFIRAHAAIESFTVLRSPGCTIDLDFERRDLGITGDRPEYPASEAMTW